ncbi:unnamed protein product [Paramecium octaurelia]|uniref:Uncharacterized protein n=1 Tax=Paramecium octaurelia TaxID=43137 RepID=A0A8S1Y7S7_PAROT|nr:unnamed protein product [Paramecium octaurelia]
MEGVEIYISHFIRNRKELNLLNERVVQRDQWETPRNIKVSMEASQFVYAVWIRLENPSKNEWALENTIRNQGIGNNTNHSFFYLLKRSYFRWVVISKDYFRNLCFFYCEGCSQLQLILIKVRIFNNLHDIKYVRYKQFENLIFNQNQNIYKKASQFYQQKPKNLGIYKNQKQLTSNLICSIQAKANYEKAEVCPSYYFIIENNKG